MWRQNKMAGSTFPRLGDVANWWKPLTHVITAVLSNYSITVGGVTMFCLIWQTYMLTQLFIRLFQLFKMWQLYSGFQRRQVANSARMQCRRYAGGQYVINKNSSFKFSWLLLKLTWTGVESLALFHIMAAILGDQICEKAAMLVYQDSLPGIAVFPVISGFDT